MRRQGRYRVRKTSCITSLEVTIRSEEPTLGNLPWLVLVQNYPEDRSSMPKLGIRKVCHKERGRGWVLILFLLESLDACNSKAPLAIAMCRRLYTSVRRPARRPPGGNLGQGEDRRFGFQENALKARGPFAHGVINKNTSRYNVS